MRILLCGVLTCAAVAAGQTPATAPSSVNSEFLIDGGSVIDGTGAPARVADVLIKGDRIVRMGRIDPLEAPAARVIDARGKVVTPGFIDAHSHGDPLEQSACENFLAMGVTTICVGQDGESPDDLAGWMRKVEDGGLGPNVVMFVGHGTVRNLAGVGLQRDPNAQQVARMQELVHEALEQGCFGLSTGLEYQPGSFADLEELVALATPVAAAGGMVMSHMRSEDDDRIGGALAELLEQGRRSGCSVHVSHIKVTYGHGAERAEAVLRQMQAARDEGLRVTADIYPYNASYTGIGIVFPDWAKPPHDYAKVVQSRRAELGEYLRRRVALRNGPEATLLGTGPWAGKTLAQVSAELDKPFEDVLIDDIGLDGAHAAYFVMDGALQERLLVDPYVMISSDGSATSRHPRGHGAFARVIRKFVIERKALPLAEAVRKMTGLPAETIGLARLKRGRLAEGWAADVLVFDPDCVRDNATYEEPHVLASGFDWVFVNGQPARAAGKATGLRTGRVLRQAGTTLQEKVAALIAEFDHPGQPGASLAVIENGEIVLAEAHGLANLATQTPVKPDTNFRIASMTKQFTAMCIVMLKERGLLAYDDPVTRFFPDFPAIGKEITVRQLLGHTSGIIDYEELVPGKADTQLKDRDVLALLQTQRGTYFTPGTRCRYSNGAYALLALIVERVSGQDFAGFLHDNIFAPLGMQGSVAFEAGVSTVPRRALGYREEGGSFVDADQSLTSAVLGDGGIYTSVVDYARWDRALYDEGLVNGEALEDIFTPGSLADGTPTIYGLGWRVDHRRGHRVVHHDGRTCGFNSAVRRVPGRRLTIVILTNRAGRRAREIADELLDWILRTGEAPVASQPAPAPSSEPVKWEWHDGRELCIEARGWDEPGVTFRRLPQRAEQTVPSAVWRLSKHTAGICVRFITDSTRIAATWDGGGAMNHMAATGNSGLDLYERRNGGWVFRAVGRPQVGRTTATLARGLTAERTEYLLYLPLYNAVSELSIGIEPGATITAGPPRSTRPLVFYGTSITQGGCASRSGMCHPAILGRHLDREVINLGFSGAGRMEPALADLLGELDAALFVLECLPNMTTEMVRERVAPFVRRLRGARPDTPILLVEHPIDPANAPGNKLLRKIFGELIEEGLTDLHYLPGESLLAGAENGTVDGVHPTDLGFARMAAAYEPVLRSILDFNAPDKPGGEQPGATMETPDPEAAALQYGLLPGFEHSPHFDEQIKAYTFDADVRVHINAPSAATFDPHKPTHLVLYALPNGNTIAQTIGRQEAPDVDWHFFIQHIGAQTRRLREVMPGANIVVAYVEAGGRSWPAWRRRHTNDGELIAELIESVKSHFAGDVSVDLTAHSGGGSLIFGYINHVDRIPPWIRRIVWLDANYGYSDEQRHGDKLIAWLAESPEHFLGVVAYDDRAVRYEGKLVVGPTGGTYRKTQRMLDRLGQDVALSETAHDAYERYRALDGRVDIVRIKNPENKILHTVLVEKNGFIHALTFGTPIADTAGELWGHAAYTGWIQPE